MAYPETFQKIIDSFKLLPGVGEKTAERYAFSIMKLDKNRLDQFSCVIKDITEKLSTCEVCGCLIESNNCSNCFGERKNSDIICVVENQKNVFTFEKLGFLNIKYHVLGGLISPMDGVNPEDISISKLINRIDKENIKELILALKPGIEGSTTTLYIKKILENKPVKITQIAQGVPLGTDMEFLDNLTLEMAIENRSELA